MHVFSMQFERLDVFLSSQTCFLLLRQIPKRDSPSLPIEYTAHIIEIPLQQHPSSLPASDMTCMSTTARAPPLPGIPNIGERSQNTEKELRRAKPSASSFRGGAASSYCIHAAS